MSEQCTITYAESTFTRIKEGKRGGWQWMCNTCHRVGWGEELLPHEWSRTCARGHFRCPWCQRWTPVVMSGYPRVHRGCKQRPEQVAEEWTAAKTVLQQVRIKLAEGAA